MNAPSRCRTGFWSLQLTLISAVIALTGNNDNIGQMYVSKIFMFLSADILIKLMQAFFKLLALKLMFSDTLINVIHDYV